MNYTDHDKLKLANTYWLLGKASENPKYNDVLRAIEVLYKFHKGTRKDGVTKEAYHQLSILSYLRCLTPLMDDPVGVLVTAVLHDTYEDYPESHELLEKEFPEYIQYIIKVSKVRNQMKIDYKQYFSEMATCHITSIVKAVDRLHNLSTMRGVFSTQKQSEYIKEVHQYFLPMLKAARKEHMRQESLYELLKSNLVIICKALEENKEKYNNEL